MKYRFCTCFDRNYLVTGLTLFRSLLRSVPDFVLYAAALDEEAYRLLQEWGDSRLVPVRLSEIEEADPEFAACRPGRSRAEYCFTLSPVLPLFLFRRFPEAETLNYLDADLFFYREPEPLYRELGESSILICPHRFPESLRWRERFGIYNVAYQIYRRTPECFRLLERWRRQCIDWCFDRVEPERFADQKYLNEWPSLSADVVVSQHVGADVGPWNWMTLDWSKAADGSWNPSGDPLLFYHYQGCRFLMPGVLCHNLGSYGSRMSGELRNYLYGGYGRKWMETRELLMRRFPREEFPLAMRANRTGFSILRGVLSGLRHHNLMWCRGVGDPTASL